MLDIKTSVQCGRRTIERGPMIGAEAMMPTFPDEESRAIEARVNLKDEFEFIERAHRFWLYREKDEWLQQSRLPARVIHLAMLLNVQAMRQVRSVVEECNRCEAFGALIAARGLYETVLALQFLLKRKVGVEVVTKTAGNGTKRYSVRARSSKSKKGTVRWLSRDFRARLYFSHGVFECKRLGQQCKSRSVLRGFSRAAGTADEKRLVAECEKDIGDEWSFILTKSHSYSGFNIADLARFIGRRHLYPWYLSIYNLQSRLQHATDALHHGKPNSRGGITALYLGTNEQISAALYIVACLLLVNIATLQINIGFGSTVETIFAEFQREFHAIFGK
jgi:Family of unknown function (DUF5677)